MILNRPANLILGAVTAVINLVALIAGAEGRPIDPAVLAGVNLVAGSIIGVVAYQPPTLSPGDKFTVQTESGQPNYETTVATPPRADAPPAPKPQ